MFLPLDWGPCGWRSYLLSSVLSPQLFVSCLVHKEYSVHICGTKGEHFFKLFLFLCFSPKFVHHSFNYLLWLLACSLVCWALLILILIPSLLESDWFCVTQARHWMKTKWWLPFAEPLAPRTPTLPSILSQLFHTSRLHPAITQLSFPIQPKCDIHQDNFPDSPSWLRCPFCDAKILYFAIRRVVHIVLQSKTYPTVLLIDS